MDWSWAVPILVALTVGGIWFSAKNAQKAAEEAAAIRRILNAIIVPEFGKQTDLQRIAAAVETLVRLEQDKRPPLGPVL